MDTSMRVLKRNGKYEEVSFDKVIRRIRSLCNKEPKLEHINPINIAQKVCSEIYDTVKTAQLDELAAQICASKITENPQYGILASRIIISNNHKATSPSFSETIYELYNYKDVHGKHCPLIDKEVYDIVRKHRGKLNDAIDYERDFSFDYFGFKTLENAYLMKINGNVIERISHMLMRVSVGIHKEDIKAVIETYDLMSKKFCVHATPTLFHAGTPNPQLLSCFLLGMGDSVSGIYKALSDCAMISKWAGGIGLWVHDVRGKYSEIRGTHGKSSGLMPLLKVFNDTARHINQCFTGNTIVYGENGPVRMEDVKVGDKLFTIDGTLKHVLKISKNKVNKEILEIRPKYSFNSVKCTKEHQIYAITDIKSNYYHSKLIKKLEDKTIIPKYINADSLKKYDYVGFPIPNDNPDINYFNIEEAFFYGLMLGDGHILKERNEWGISLNKKSKIKLIEWIQVFLEKKGVHYWTSERDDMTYYIRWSGSPKLPFGRDELYDHTDIKNIPNKILNNSNEILRNIVKGLLLTDGSMIGEIYFTTTSENLAYSIRFMLLKLGVLTSGCIKNNIGKTHINKYGRKITTKLLSYQVRIPKTKEIKEILHEWVDIKESKIIRYFKYDNILWTRILNIEKCNFEGQVYDFNMEDNHNYLTDMGIVHNSGKRNGSFAIYLEPWHTDIREFLEAKKNHGDENSRARDLFYALWIPDLFMERVKEDKPWSLMCPDKCRGLSEAYGEKFKELYEEYEKTPGMVNSTLPAREIWQLILSSQIETGTPYILYKDAANIKSNQKNLGTIRSSNLCTEILEYSDTEEYACCTLASIGLPAFVIQPTRGGEIVIYTTAEGQFSDYCKKYLDSFGLSYTEHKLETPKQMNDKRIELSELYGKEIKTFPQIIIDGEYVGGLIDLITKKWRPTFDFNKLIEVSGVLTRNLNKVIDLNYYPVPETKRSNLRHRPIGIGVQGLADVYALFNVSFDSPEAMELNRQIFAAVYYGSMKESLEQSKLYGPYETFKGSPLSEGKFQFDLWEKEPIRELPGDVLLDWESLRSEIIENGVRNSLLLAPMPTASTSQILGYNEAIEPFTSNIYSRQTLAGDFVIVNKYLMDLLNRIGIWSLEMKEQILIKNGSIQELKSIPDFVKNIYKVVWDLSMKTLIDQAADRGIYICQSQSLNLWLKDPDYSKLSSMHMYSWNKGLKTGIYYLRTRAAAKAQQFTIDPSKYLGRLIKDEDKVNTDDEEVCNMDEGCLMCSA